MTADRILRIGIIFAIFLGGCTPATPAWPTTDPAIDQAVATQVAQQTQTAAVVETASPVVSAQPLQPVTTELSPAPASLLAGLVVSADTTFQFQADGTQKKFSTYQIEAVSPDLSHGLTNSNGDLWLQSFADQKYVRLTMTETRVECCMVWWVNHPEKILFLSNTLGGNNGVANHGYLTVVKQDGTGYQVLDPDHPSTGTPAVSSDGTWIAYGSGASGWIFGGELGPQEVRPADYGLQSAGTLSNPVWSPDGDHLGLDLGRQDRPDDAAGAGSRCENARARADIPGSG